MTPEFVKIFDEKTVRSFAIFSWKKVPKESANSLMLEQSGRIETLVRCRSVFSFDQSFFGLSLFSLTIFVKKSDFAVESKLLYK